MEQYVKAKLNKLYPDKVVSNLTSDANFYSCVRKVAISKNNSVQGYLTEIGYKYLPLHKGILGKEFDYEVAKLLIDEYGFKRTIFARLLDLGRAEISRKIINKVKNVDWRNEYLSDSEVEYIKYLISENEYKIDEDDLYIQIANNGKEVCVLFKIDDSIKVFFKFPNELDKLLKNKNYHYFREEDKEIKEYLLPTTVMGRRLAKYKEPLISQKIAKRCKEMGIVRDEYLKLHGYEGFCDGKTVTDDKIVEILQQYSNDQGVVYFPSRGPDKRQEYHSIANRASRENMSLDVFFEFFGFFKDDDRLKTTYSLKMEEFKEEISEHLIDDDGDKVFIKTDSPLYKKLYPFAKRRNLTIDGLLNNLGFKRVFDENTEFEAFNREKNEKSKVEKIITELKGLAGTLDKVKTENETKKRNVKIVERLKELYKCRCQLCSEKGLNLPPIEKNDGTYYVEVHHIKPIAESDAESDELIDVYTNAIVVCPYHHKVLHYHQGGYKILIEKDRQLFFVSERGSRICVEENHHLKVENETIKG
jgi:hypothetical protein